MDQLIAVYIIGAAVALWAVRKIVRSFSGRGRGGSCPGCAGGCCVPGSAGRNEAAKKPDGECRCGHCG